MTVEDGASPFDGGTASDGGAAPARDQGPFEAGIGPEGGVTADGGPPPPEAGAAPDGGQGPPEAGVGPAAGGGPAGGGAPSTRFDLTGWKLQIPGPLDIFDLEGYASQYFYLDAADRMTTWVDASETGTTPNSTHVRSELRHLTNWDLSGTHVLTAELEVSSQVSPDQVTCLQIHANGSGTPPFVRIALEGGTVYAHVKTDDTGGSEDKILLASGMVGRTFQCRIEVTDAELTITLDGDSSQVNRRDISFWPYASYFKAGVYPQANEGTAWVAFTSLFVSSS